MRKVGRKNGIEGYMKGENERGGGGEGVRERGGGGGRQTERKKYRQTVIWRETQTDRQTRS